MMSESVTVTVPDGAGHNSNNPRQTPTVKSEPGQHNLLGGLALNVPYFTSIPGIIKLVQLFFGIICMACASPAVVSATHWFLFVVVSAFILTLIWCFLYLLSLREALKIPLDWVLTELINTVVMTVLYFTAFIAQLSVWTAWGGSFAASNVAAGVFGIFNTLAYAAGIYFLFLEWKSNRQQ